MKPVYPPGPKGAPLFGNFFQFKKDKLTFLTDAARTYGDIVHFRPGPLHAYVFSNPEHIREILIERAAKLPKHWLQQWIVEPLFGNGIGFSSGGEVHRRQRRLAQPAFHQARMDGYCRMFVEHTRQAMEGWKAGAEFELDREMQTMTVKNVCKALFNGGTAHMDERAEKALQTALEFLNIETNLWVRFPSWLPLEHIRKKKEVIQTVNEVVMKFAEDWRAAGGEDRGDFLSMLMLARDEEGRPMAEAELREWLVSMFAAGHETTASALTWTWIMLARYPEVEAALHHELDRVLGGRTPTPEDIPKLTYVTMVLKETMRLYPPVWIFMLREPVEDLEIGGYTIKKGSFVIISPYIVHRNPRYFPEPERFLPERFAPSAEKQIPKGAFFPFGMGARSCIGQSFAMSEAALVVATVAQRFRISVLPGQRLEQKGQLTLRPTTGIRARFIARDSGDKAAIPLLPSL
jgi:cytochrome P450